MTRGTVLAKAQFDSKLKTYSFLSVVLFLLCTIIGSPLLLFWFLFGKSYCTRHFEALDCTLTDKSLCLKKGVWFRLEKTIPLDKITDLALAEGPFLRYFGLSNLKIETAGQSAPGGANLDMTGIINPMAFRDKVLAQRDILVESRNQAAPVQQAETAPVGGDTEVLLGKILETLERMESHMADQSKS